MSNRPVIQKRESDQPVVPPNSNRPVVQKENNRPVIKQQQHGENMVMVAAIDFGTTFSGYAFSYRSTPTDIHCPHWNTPSAELISHKIPTTVLLDGKKNFIAFGYEAEAQYLELAEKGKDANNYYYFRRFKMMLYDKIRTERLTTETKVTDIKGKLLPAVDVFAHAIRYLKECLVKEIERKDTSVLVQTENITWVLTVPAIWDEPAKQFMRKAAEKAGIDGKKLLIALEPEAASLYCKEVPVEKLSGSESGIGIFSPGRKYLVLDAGGGTIDMTVHEVKSEGKLHELSRASGGNWGGLKVDMTFKQMLTEIVGDVFMKAYCLSNTAEYIEMFRDFEIKKRQKVDEKSQRKKITMKVPATFVEKYEEENKDIGERTKETAYGGLLKWELDKVRINKDTFDNFFKPSCEGIIQHVRKLLSYPKVKGTDIILMVGGFSESAVVQKAVRDAFPKCRVVIPREAGLAVLKGAVLFGHDPSAVASRIAKFTYGIECTELFDPKKHDRKKKKKIEGTDRCEGIFSKHVETGAVLYLNEEQGEHKYYPIYANQKKISFPLYATEALNPTYVDEPGCKYVGTLTMDIPNTAGGLEREFAAKLKFGGTEMTVTAKNTKTGEVASAEFNFLDNEP